jgi:pimeloyl-ACP methyl ester carboxylesterase
MPTITTSSPASASTGAKGSSGNCSTYFASLKSPPADAQRWCNEGSYFTFASPTNAGRLVQLFWRCAGDVRKPTIVLGHGYPTSSFDFLALSALLEPFLRVCSVDYVGHGFSDKPPAPFHYHIDDHAYAVYELITHINRGVTRFVYLTHDEGSSVGFRFLQLLEEKTAAGTPAPFELTHHFVLDGSIYLPAASITDSQKRLLSNVTGPDAQAHKFASTLAIGIGHKLCTPPLTLAQTESLASIFAYRNGTHVMHEVIQYLEDRHRHEVQWLEVLGRATVNCSPVWGTLDPIATLNVSDYVWENYLRDRTSAPATYTKVVGANHYLAVDHAKEVADIVLTDLHVGMLAK